MNKVWRKNFDTYLQEAEERGLEPFRTRDGAYEELRTRLAGQRRDCRDILGRLPEEEQKALKDFHACREELLQLEKHESYRQGHLDCVRLLRRLKLWEVFR